MADEPTYTIDATTTSLALLETLVESTDGMGVTQLADSLDVSKSVAHNHLSTLRAKGYVVKRGRTYEPSLRSLYHGSRTREGMAVYEASRTHLDNLAAASGETAVLFVFEEGYGVPLYITETAKGWSPQYTVGQRLPIHVNAPGKAILASLPEDRVDEVVDSTDLVARTSATITDPEELRTELRGIRDNALAFCRGEQYEGIVGIAVSVTTASADRTAAIGICGPVDRLNGRYLEEDITGQVLSTAKSAQVDLRQQ